MDSIQEAATRSVAAGAISAAAGLVLTGATGAGIALPLLAAAIGLDVVRTGADRRQRKQLEDAFRRLINHGQASLDEVLDELHQCGIDEALAHVTPGDLNDRLTALADLGHIITESSEDHSRRLEQIEGWMQQQAAHLKGGYSSLTTFIAENTSDIRTLLCNQHSDLTDRLDAVDSHLEQIKRGADANDDTGIERTLLHRFGSRIQAVTSALAEPLDTSRDVLRYYKGEYPLTWGIIAAGAVVERDAYSALMDTLRDGTSNARLICLVGEPGSGKSSLAWQAAYDLATNNEMAVVHLRDDADGEIWFQLPQLQQELDTPMVVLSDDVFRGTDPAGAISSIPSFLPITIIATSRTNELVSRSQIELPFKKIPVGPVTPAERERIATRLEVRPGKLTAEERRRFETETDILVLMMEATGSRGHREVLANVARRLRSKNECLFQAFEYVCHSHAYDVSVPASLIDRLDATGRSHDLLSRHELDGLLFANAPSDWLSTSHSRRAKIIVEVAGRSPRIAINEMLHIVRIDDDDEALWSLKILASVSNSSESELACELYAQNRAKMETLQQNVPRFYWLGWKLEVQEALDWADSGKLQSNLTRADEWLTRHDNSSRARIAMYELLNRLGYRHALRSRLNSDRTPFDDRWDHSYSVHTWLSMVSALCDAVQLANALDSTQRWLADHPQDGHVREYWLTLVERTGDAKRITDAINLTERWLADHPRNISVRQFWLGLVERTGDAKRITEGLDLSERWLADHPQDNCVRSFWLGMVERTGDAKRITEALDLSERWLADHPQDKPVRSFWLGMVERTGDAKRIAEAMDRTERWLADHPQNSNVREAWLGMVERTGDVKRITDVLDLTERWLADHPRDISVRRFWLRMVERTIDAKRIAVALDLTERWLADHPQDSDVRQFWLGVVERRGDAKCIAEALDLTERWLADQPENGNIRQSWLAMVERTRDTKRITDALDTTKLWLADYPQDNNVRVFWLGMVERTRDTKRITDALDSTKLWLADHPQDNYVRQFWLGMTERRRDPDRILDALDSIERWLADHPENGNVRQSWLGMVERTRDPDRILDALDSIERWLADHPENGNVRQSWLGMVERTGDAKRITDALDSTGRWLAKHTRHPDVRGAWLELAAGAGSAIELATAHTWAKQIARQRTQPLIRAATAFVGGAGEWQNGRIESAARHFAQSERLNRRLMRLGRARTCLFLRTRLEDQLQLRGKKHGLWQALHDEINESGGHPNVADLQRAYERMVNRPPSPHGTVTPHEFDPVSATP